MEDCGLRASESYHQRTSWSLSARVWILLLSFLSFAIRVLALDAQPIWWDEAISIHLANSSLEQIVANRAGNLHPPTYFFLLKGWTILTGDSAFSARFLSVWFSTLLVPALYAFGRRWFNRHIGLIGAALGALSPLYLAYAQEARVYALLPLAYLTLIDLFRRLNMERSPRWFIWLALALVEALALGMHYMSLFAVAYLIGKTVIHLRRRRVDLMRLLAVQGGVALLLLPWLLTVLGHIDALGARLGMTNWQAGPVTLAHFTRLLWLFQLTGRTALLSDRVAIGLMSAVGLGLGGALVALIARRDSRRPAAELLLDWLIPLTCAFVVWKVRPLSHPRYVVIFTPPLLLLIAYAVGQLARRSPVERGWAVLLALSVLASFALGHYLNGLPRFAKDDTRGAAETIAAEATADDLVLVPPEDWSVPYYYDGPARVEMLWPGDTPADWERLAELTEGVDTVFLVDYYLASRDPRGLLPFALESAGSMIERWDFKGLYVCVYRLEGAIVPPQLSPVDAQFGSLRLIGAWVEQEVPADTALPVALRWRKEANEQGDTSPYRANLSLQGPDHWGWAMNDDWLLNRAALPVNSWEAGLEATTYHLLPLAPGTPPLTYTLELGVYEVEEGEVQALDLLDRAGNPQGQAFDLGAVTLEPPLNLERDPYQVDTRVPLWETPVELQDGLWLEGAVLDRAEVGIGHSLFVALRWRGTAALECAPPPEATVLLEREGEPLATAGGLIGDRYTCDRWVPGQTVEEHRRLEVPLTAEPGMADVVLQTEGHQVDLGRVEIREQEYTFTPPPMEHQLGVRFGDVAELLGYDLEEMEVASDETVGITLYWRALEGADEKPYTVFTHILAGDGHLVGQHDGPPADGRRPTPSWIEGEIIVDRHEMAFREPYAGSGRIEVGLYDPATLDRVPTADGQTFLILPTELQINDP